MTTATPPSPSSRLPAWLAPAAFALILLAGLGAVILLARQAGAPDVPPQPPAFAPPQPTRPVIALDVQQAAAGRLTLSDGSRDVPPRPDARIEALRPEIAAGVRVGDWVTAVGVPNEVRNFSIRSLVVIASPGPPDAEGIVRSAGGFAGHEPARDQRERPLLGGVVERIDGDRLVLRSLAGPLTLDLTPAAPLRRLTDARAGDIQEGDRIAFPAGHLSDAPALLVLPGGAR